MSSRKWNRQIARLEKAGNDDFLLILTGGAGAFATHELHHLLRRLRLQSAKIKQVKDAMFKVGLAIPFLLFSASAAALASLHWLVGLCLLAIPLALVGLVLADRYINRIFSCHERAKRLRYIINQELERRRKGVYDN
jgi:ABC-type multidrug transport system fused ATPase/permease subunit